MENIDFATLFQGIGTMMASGWVLASARVFLVLLGLLLIYLGWKGILEPMVMIPMGLGMVAINCGTLIMPDGTLGNLFLDPMLSDTDQLMNTMQIDFLQPVYTLTFSNGLIACFVFMGIGTLLDVGFLLQKPFASIFLALCAELGTFLTVPIASALGLTLKESASVAMVGGADGPMVLFTSLALAKHLFVPITVVAYLYLGALVPAQESTLQNVEGNHSGSWNAALSYYAGDWKIRAYMEHFFEDHSQMFMEYGMWKDGQLGLEVTLPRNRWVNRVLWEGLSTKDQTGPILYDGIAGSFPEFQISGGDNYFNNGQYLAWQHWGMGMGNGLIPGPVYNDDGTMLFKSTRVKAHHIGFCGEPDSEWNYRVLASYVRHWGTYPMPLDKVRKQFSSMVEVSYCPRKWTGWSATLAFAMDRGNYLGNSMGAMLTVRKTGGFGK